MKKNISLIIIILLILLVGSYFIPTSQKGFLKLYKLDDDISKSLKEFQTRKLKTINVDGLSWKYYSGGKGKETILFLHGMGGAYDLWWQQINALEKNYKVISYSLPEEISTLESASNGVLKILQTEHIDTFNGVGTSMGGYILQYLMQKIPNRINKVVLSNTFSVNNTIITKNKKKSKIVPLLPEIVISKLANKQLKEQLIPAGKNSKLLAAFLPSLPFTKKQFINRYHIVVEPFLLKQNYNINRIPKLIIESDNDPLVEKSLRKSIKNLYSNTKVYTFHNEGHFPYINSSDEYNKILLNFFQSENKYKEVEKTINNYFNGRKFAKIDVLKKAFTKDALLYTVENNKQRIIPLEEYLEKISNNGQKSVKTKIINGSIINNIASFQTSFEYSEDTYQDFLILMKINNEWKIKSKTFSKIK